MLITGRIENFKEYSNFRDLKDFNNNIEMFLAEYKKCFTESECILFKRLTKYCAKVKGVANASIREILRGIKEKDFKYGFSESTFHRMKRKAIKLGILEIVPTNRKNGSQSTNLWIFKRFQNNDTPRTKQEQVELAPQKKKDFRRLTPLKTRNISFKTNNHFKERKIEFNHTYTAKYVPSKFVQTVKPYYDNAVVIEDFWKSVFLDTRKVTGIVDNETITETAIDAFKQSIRRYKAGKVKNTLVQYFTGTFKKMMDSIITKNLIETEGLAAAKEFEPFIPVKILTTSKTEEYDPHTLNELGVY